MRLLPIPLLLLRVGKCPSKLITHLSLSSRSTLSYLGSGNVEKGASVIILRTGVRGGSFVKFKTPIAALAGTWDPYPIAMEFKPPCMVLSTIGLEKPGKLNGTDVDACPTHLHQLHVCMPSSRGKTRLLYRMALDFAPFLKHVPFISYLWQYLANQVNSCSE